MKQRPRSSSARANPAPGTPGRLDLNAFRAGLRCTRLPAPGLPLGGPRIDAGAPASGA